MIHRIQLLPGQTLSRAKADEIRRWCPYVDSEKSARRLLKIANPFEPGQGGRIQIEKINEPLLKDGDSPAEFGVGLELTIARGWL